MASELGNQLLARVQDEMARNIATIKRQLIEWLERPESGGVEPLAQNRDKIPRGPLPYGKNGSRCLGRSDRRGR